MKDNERYGRKGGGQGEKSQKRVISSHPPIIITDDTLDGESFAAAPQTRGAALKGDDMIIRFDAENGAHYRDVNSTTYRADNLQEIDGVEVTDEDGNTHSCPDVPPHCRIEVLGKKGGNPDEKITVTANGRITIVFNRGAYTTEPPTGNRKKHRGALRKIKQMKIFDSAGQLVHDCPAVGDAKDVHIAICDDDCVPLP